MATNVNYERILNARSEPQNWLTYYGAYDGQRYSPLDQINTENVKRIGPVWIFQAGATGQIAGASTYCVRGCPDRRRRRHVRLRLGRLVLGPRREDGPGDLALQARGRPSTCRCAVGTSTAAARWPRARSSSSRANAHLLALDATNGKTVWDKTYGDVRAGESATVAPLVVKNMVIVGSSGGEFGVRGHLDAFDLETGEHLWRMLHGPEAG